MNGLQLDNLREPLDKNAKRQVHFAVNAIVKVRHPVEPAVFPPEGGELADIEHVRIKLIGKALDARRIGPAAARGR